MKKKMAGNPGTASYGIKVRLIPYRIACQGLVIRFLRHEGSPTLYIPGAATPRSKDRQGCRAWTIRRENAKTHYPPYHVHLAGNESPPGSGSRFPLITCAPLPASSNRQC